MIDNNYIQPLEQDENQQQTHPTYDNSLES